MPSESSLRYDREGAAAFSALAAYIAPVTEAVVGRLPDLAPGSVVVDLACGPGEPGFSVLGRFPEVQVVGVDNSPDMLALARERATARTRFVQADLEQLDLPDDSADAVVSRFGFLTFEDTDRSIAEFARIARPGCAYSIAFWDQQDSNSLAYEMVESLRDLVDNDLLPPLDEQHKRAVEQRQINAMRSAGVEALHDELFTWSASVASFEAVWSQVAGRGIFHDAVSSVDDDGVVAVRRRYSERLAPYARDDGSYLVPMRCRLLWGRV